MLKPYLYTFSLYENPSFIIFSAETEYISTRSWYRNMIWKIQKKSKLNSEKIGKMWKKVKLNNEMIWKIWKKSKMNSEMIWKISKKGKLNSEKI